MLVSHHYTTLCITSLFRQVHGPSSNSLIYSTGTGDLYTPHSTAILATHLESPLFRTMVTLQLLHLPNELLVIIFSNTPARSILTGWALCRRLRALIEQSMSLQKRMWNMKHGIQELSPSGLSIPDFETYVRQWEKDWLNFTVEMQEATRSMYRSTEGSLIREPRCPTECNFLMRSGYLIEMHQKENPGWSHINLSLLRERRGIIKDQVWTDVRLGEHLTMGGWALDLDLDLVAASLLS
jgi:hypothetical protein